MIDTLLFTINAIGPIIFLILLGYFLRRINFFSDNLVKDGNKLIFHVALPVLLFYNIYSVESLASINWPVILYACLSIIAIFFLGLITVLLCTKDNKKRGAILQATFRCNFAIIGLPLAEALGGAKALQVASIFAFFVIVTTNTLSVIALTIFNENNTRDHLAKNIKKVLVGIAKNPLIIAIVIAISTVLIRELLLINDNGVAVFTIKNDVPVLYKTIKSLSSMVTPFALIVLGASFKFSATKSLFKDIAIGVGFKIILCPAMVLGIGLLLSNYTNFLSISADEIPALLAIFASPVAVSSAIMAYEMKSDGELAGQIVVWSSALSIFTLSILIIIFRSSGLL